MDLRTVGRVLPDLRIVPRDRVALHEDADPLRVARLAERLRADGLLRNPPVAASAGGRFIILDGANRVSALAQLGVPVVPVQVVDYDDPEVRVDVWRHLLLEIAPAELFGRAGVPLEPRSRTEAGEALQARRAAAAVLTRAEAWTVPLDPARPLAAVLAEVVGAYRGRVRIYRVPTDDVDALAREYGEQAAVVAFPRLEKADIVEIAASAARLPTGITRHLIPGRALRVNVPMALLTAGDDPGRLDERLQSLIRQRLLEGSVRYYPEGAFLFDE